MQLNCFRYIICGDKYWRFQIFELLDSIRQILKIANSKILDSRYNETYISMKSKHNKIRIKFFILFTLACVEQCSINHIALPLWKIYIPIVSTWQGCRHVYFSSPMMNCIFFIVIMKINRCVYTIMEGYHVAVWWYAYSSDKMNSLSVSSCLNFKTQ